jgi:hypothetical protein
MVFFMAIKVFIPHEMWKANTEVYNQIEGLTNKKLIVFFFNNKSKFCFVTKNKPTN